MKQIITVFTTSTKEIDISKFENDNQCKFIFDEFIGFQAGYYHIIFFLSNVKIDTSDILNWTPYGNGVYRKGKENIWLSNVSDVNNITHVAYISDSMWDFTDKLKLKLQTCCNYSGKK